MKKKKKITKKRSETIKKGIKLSEEASLIYSVIVAGIIIEAIKRTYID